jgi:hypothetical protein
MLGAKGKLLFAGCKQKRTETALCRVQAKENLLYAGFEPAISRLLSVRYYH